MPKLTRIRSGKIYYTDFDEIHLDNFWSVSPSSKVGERYSLEERNGFLRLKHATSEFPTRLLFDMPKLEQFVLEIKNEYYPSVEGNEGGLTAFQEVRNKLELLEYFDGAKGVSVNYSHMRLRKVGNTFEGYGTKDGKHWDLIGAKTTNEMEKIGFVLYGLDGVTSEPMDIDYMSVFRDTHLHVQNLEPDTVVEIFDDVGVYVGSSTVKKNEDSVRIDVSHMPMPFKGFLRWNDPTGTFVDDTPMMEIWGGDTFWSGVYLDFYIDDDKLLIEEDFDLGNMKDGVIEVPVEVENPTEEPIREIYLDVLPYYYYSGHKWVNIAQDNFGVPGSYQRTIYIGDIFPGERHFFWLKIRRVPAEQEAQFHPYKFRIMAYNDFKPERRTTAPTLATSFVIGPSTLTTTFTI